LRFLTKANEVLFDWEQLREEEPIAQTTSSIFSFS